MILEKLLLLAVRRRYKGSRARWRSLAMPWSVAFVLAGCHGNPVSAPVPQAASQAVSAQAASGPPSAQVAHPVELDRPTGAYTPVTFVSVGSNAKAGAVQASTTSPYASAVLTDTPVAYYRLGDTPSTAPAADSATGTANDPSGHPGAYNGVAPSGLVQATAGLLANDPELSLTNNGMANADVAVLRDGSFESSTISIEAWVKLSSVARYQSIVEYGDTAGTNFPFKGYGLKYDTANASFALKIALTPGGTLFIEPKTGQPGNHPSVGTIYHLVGTYDGAVANLYVNGQLAASLNSPGTIAYNAAGTAAGLVITNNQTGQVNFLGTIQEVALYKTALTPARILAHYNAGAAAQPPTKFNVTTYHYDTLRTGWNPNEPTLTQANVNTTQFALLHTVSLDDQVDGQPLVVANQPINGQGVHDVVYVATEHNTVYAIDASTGAVLLQKNLGSPVPTPLGCNNNGPNVGINSTPVIDLATHLMYVIVYTQEGQPVYRIHALDLATLTDKVPPVLITASHSLSGGPPNTYNFQPGFSRQRNALLEANGNIYAGFSSFCDYGADQSRGWLLGWKAGSLTPLGANQLDDYFATSPSSPNNFFLSSIWMSGYGVAADPLGNLFFATGNSDPKGTSFQNPTNITESVAEEAPDLSAVKAVFTDPNWSVLDIYDQDFGSGGVLLLPDQTAPIPPHLAVAAGKSGQMYLLNRDNLGSALSVNSIGECWCGASYFLGSDRIPRVVSSGGSQPFAWTVQGSAPYLVKNVTYTPSLMTGQDPGFFTTVSSNGTNAGTGIVWAVSRPQSTANTAVTLYAFRALSGTLLYSAVAGDWAQQSLGGNANIVPVVANGKVYVASNIKLTIFGLK